jgi:TPR repeat protein
MERMEVFLIVVGLLVEWAGIAALWWIIVAACLYALKAAGRSVEPMKELREHARFLAGVTVAAVVLFSGIVTVLVLAGAFNPADERSLAYVAYAKRDVDPLKELAEAGQPWGQVYLATVMAERRRMDQANYWWLAAAEQNNISAMMRLADLYESRGDFVISTEWLRRGALLADPTAEREYGWALMHGRGAEANAEEALRWFHAAARHGEKYALLSVAQLYDRGEVIARDPVEAYAYALAAQRQFSWGSPPTPASTLARLEPELSPADRRKAEARAKEIRASLRQ